MSEVDYFAVLGMARGPWLDAEETKQRFHELSAKHHPDVTGGGSSDFSEINEAHTVLRDPQKRLRHLLELAFPDLSLDAAAVPVAVADLFMELGSTLKSADDWLVKRQQATTKLNQALLQAQKPPVLEKLAALSERIAAQEGSALGQLQSLAADWPQHPETLREILQRLIYLNRTASQLQQREQRLTVDFSE